MKLELRIPRKHHAVLFSDKHHLCLFGGRGGAKSTSAAAKLVIEMCRARKRVACCRQYQSNIRESSKELVEQIIRDNDLSDQFKITEQEIIHRLNGSQMIFIGLEKNLDKVRSIVDVDLWWIDEAQNCSRESIDVLIPTARKQGSQLIWTWNPTNPSDPIEIEFRGPHSRADVAIACVLWSDNPFFFQTTMPGEKDWLERVDPAKADHIWGGLHDRSYDANVFNPSRIVEGRPYVPGHVRPVFGFDHGFTTDPLVILKIYPLGDTLYIQREIVAHGVSMEQIPDLLDSILNDRGDLVTADGANPIILDYLQSKGFAVHAARKGWHSVQKGITHLKGFKIVADPDCPVTLNEFRRLRWQTEKLSGKVISGANPIGSDHCVDAVKYGCQDVFPGPPVTDDDDDDYDSGVLYWRPWG